MLYFLIFDIFFFSHASLSFLFRPTCQPIRIQQQTASSTFRNVQENTSLLANYMEIHLQMDTINYAEELRGVLWSEVA